MEKETETRVCLRCGKLVSSEDRFCTSCGADLTNPVAVAPADTANPGDFRRSNLPYGHAASGSTPPLPMYTAPGIRSTPPAYPVYRGPAPYFTARKTDDMAIASLIAGVASFVFLPFIAGIAAIIMGMISRDNIRKKPYELEGYGTAMAGIILGIINVVLVVGILILAAVAVSYSAMLFLPF